MSASAGRVLIKPKGVYNPTTPYEKYDSVFFNGSSYICINDTLGHAPTDSEYWQIMAQGARVISGAFTGACDSLGSAQVKSVIIPQTDNFELQKGVIVGVRFTNTNTYEATLENSIALNVNNTGALPIYFGGTATPLGVNVVAFGEAAYTHFYQYDGSNWVFIGRSGVQTAEQTPYDNTESGLTATDAQEAIDELAAEKADKVSGATNGNFAGLNASGNLTDSGKKASDFATDDEMSAIVNVYGSKQMIPYPYDETTKTENGLTYTDNGNGTITIGTGTASATTWFYIKNASLSLKKGSYIFNGCPTGGASSSYSAYVYNAPDAFFDFGSGVSFDLASDTTGIIVAIRIIEGTEFSSPITFKPMIRDARISDDTYVPYAMTNRELTEKVIVEDISSKFTPTANVVSASSSFKAEKIGNLVLIDFVFAPKTGVTTLNQLEFYSVDASVRPKSAIFFIVNVIADITNTSTKSRCVMLDISTTHIFAPNQGGSELDFTTGTYTRVVGQVMYTI